jgi:hypothetical protein
MLVWKSVRFRHFQFSDTVLDYESLQDSNLLFRLRGDLPIVETLFFAAIALCISLYPSCKKYHYYTRRIR